MTIKIKKMCVYDMLDDKNHFKISQYITKTLTLITKIKQTASHEEVCLKQ